jgi:hypothetical protein
MANHTIGQFGQHDGIVLEPRAVTVQTPTHIHFLRHGDGHLADFCMAILAVETGCYVWTVAEVDKVRQYRYRYPQNGFFIFDIGCQFVRFGAGFGDLLMAGTTHGRGWQTRRLSSQGSRMTEQALDPQGYVLVMWKLDGLGWRELSLADTEDRASQQDHAHNP